MHRSKNSFLEWLVYSLIFFFLYDIIWLLVDLPDFLQSVNGLYPELLVDFALCGLFSLLSMYLLSMPQIPQKRSGGVEVAAN
jgi:hypothetical protein